MQKIEDQNSSNFDGITLQKDDFNERRGLYKQNPYINNGCEMPITSSFGPTWYKFRSWILSPIHKKIYKNFTFGELLFTLFILQLFVITVMPTHFNAHSRGHHCAILLGFIFLFTMKNSFFTFICGIPYERQIYWHKILSLMLYPMVLVHFHQAKRTNPYETEFDFTHQKHSGYTTFGGFFMMVIFSFYPVRKYCAKVFAVVHAICTPIVCVGIFAHRAGYARYAVIFFLIERVYRVCSTRFNKKNTVEARLVKMGNDIVRITFNKGTFNYMSGQYFFLNVPSISFFEWHPFYASSQPEEAKIEFLVKATGGWTRQLLRLAESGQEVKIIVNGPYGNLHSSIDLEPYNNFLLISGGVGLAPIKSVAKNLIKQKNMGRSINRIQFAHSSKETQLSQLILDQDEMQELSSIQIFNTGRNSRNDVEQNEENSKVQVYNQRPSFDMIFQNFVHSLSSSQQSLHRVAVITSCPESMAEEVKRSVEKYSSNYIKLDHYPQTYEF